VWGAKNHTTQGHQRKVSIYTIQCHRSKFMACFSLLRTLSMELITWICC
jgi:hypothetical protein